MYKINALISKFLSLDFYSHIRKGAIIRFLLIGYSLYHDMLFSVPYTDIDYFVFKDAAQFANEGHSPYKRQTYRYSPLIAFLMIPSLYLGEYTGKILFCAFDIFLALASKNLIEYQLQGKRNAEEIAKYSTFFWLYNPLSIAISTRGNADSIPGFLVIVAVFFLQTPAVSDIKKYVFSGIFLGLAIHLRIYPIIFSFPMYLSLGEYKINRETDIVTGLKSLLPNKKQLILTFSCLTTIAIITMTLYNMYGFEFLFETYIYHLFRKDPKHNFSIAFYHTYLNVNSLTFDIVLMTLQVFKVILLFIVSLMFGTNPQTLYFALFCQAAILVIYNSVMTSQYFVWFLSLLPLVVHSFKMSPLKAILLFITWLAAQGGWLFYAYLLEFQNQGLFINIWAMGVAFFCVNVYILAQLIKSYTPDNGFGMIDVKSN